MSCPVPAPVGPTSAPSCFRIQVDLGTGRLLLAGPLDRSTVHLLHDGISTLLLTDGDAWVVDASSVTSCDSAGLRAIGSAYRRALRHRRRMRLIGTPPLLRESLSRLRLDSHLLVGDDDGVPVAA
jgi:anti-anti-sigma factor